MCTRAPCMPKIMFTASRRRLASACASGGAASSPAWVWKSTLPRQHPLLHSRAEQAAASSSGRALTPGVQEQARAGVLPNASPQRAQQPSLQIILQTILIP